MEQHPIPRNITGFEFKLIGFMTLHQFIYLVIFFPIGFIVYKIVPIPFLNILLGLITAAVGAAFAFIPYQDRPLEVWIRNLWKRLNAPTQYIYHKNNPPIELLQNLYFVTDPHKVLAHIESREKLSAYLAKTKPVLKADPKKQTIQTLLQKPTTQLGLGKKPSPPTPPQAPRKASSTPLPSTMQTPAAIESPTHPFLIGVVKNNKRIPLPGVLVYIKDQQAKPLRLLKTNPHGVFASFHELPKGDYTVEAKDPKGGYFFDTMKLSITNEPLKQLEINSKELL